jgi:hypothetical protein
MSRKFSKKSTNYIFLNSIFTKIPSQQKPTYSAQQNPRIFSQQKPKDIFTTKTQEYFHTKNPRILSHQKPKNTFTTKPLGGEQWQRKPVQERREFVVSADHFGCYGPRARFR